MKAQARYFRVGLFVLVAVALGLAGIIILGAGEYFRVKIPFETYVDESVQGLDVGAPVKYRGVHVGNVEAIDFVRNRYPSHKHYVFIRMSIYPDKLGRQVAMDAPRRAQEEIAHGLRIRLASQGLTGGVYLEVDYVDPQQNPPLEIDWSPMSNYVPSAPSTSARMLDRVGRVIAELDDAGIDQVARRLGTLLEELSRAVGRIEGVLGNVDRAAVEAVRALEEMRRVLKEDVGMKVSSAVDTLQRAMERDVSPAFRDVSLAAREIPAIVERIERTLRKVDRTVSAQELSIDEAVDNLRVISEDVRELTGNLKRYPSQALFGEPPPRVKGARP